MSTAAADEARSRAVQVVVGRIGRPHGLRGEVSVEVRTDEPDRRFAPGILLTTEAPSSAVLRVRSSRQHGTRLLVVFDGVSDRQQAQALQGRLLTAEVDEDERPTDPAEFYDHQLVGLQVRTTDDQAAGVIVGVTHLPAQDVLVIAAKGGSEVLVPFVADLVPVVDLDGGWLTVEDRPDLLHGSAPGP